MKTLYRTLFLLVWLVYPQKGIAESLQESSRFLNQASFGATDSLVANVQSIGFEAWLSQQRLAPISHYPALTAYPANDSLGCPDAATRPQCLRDNYSQYPLQVQFFKHARYGSDQLRLRMAWALHQILVISGNQIRQPSAMAVYLNLLQDHALGNYRELLQQITLNAAMGDYLDMVNNDKPSADNKVVPNENYARELLQLFTLGTEQLHPDGSVIRDSNGNAIPSYTQDEIEGVAYALTGWTYAPLPGAPSKAHNPAHYLQPMTLYRVNGKDVNHDKSSKVLPTPQGKPQQRLAANQDGMQDFNQTLDAIFAHPNVAPFICTRLIRALVTSNPSPAYVARVSAVFNNNGQNSKGDLFATARAILLDTEARASVQRDDFGLLREPVVMMAHFMRALDITTDGIINEQAIAMGQNVFNPPTVFNYYPLDYRVPGTALFGPAFALQSSSALLARSNFINTLVYSAINPPSPATGTRLDLTPWTELAAQPSPNALLSRIEQRLFNGHMPLTLRQTISAALSCTLDSSKTFCKDAKPRAQTALYLAATAPDYQIQR